MEPSQSSKSPWFWSESGAKTFWGYEAGQRTADHQVALRIYGGPGAYAVEAIAVFNGDAHRMVLQGGNDFSTLNEAQRKAEIMGNWLMYQRHPLTSPFLTPQPIWNPEVILPLFDANSAS